VSFRTLRNSPIRSALTCCLVSIAALSTSCASGTAAQLGDTIKSLAGSGSGNVAWFGGSASRAECAGCLRRARALLRSGATSDLSDVLSPGTQVGRRSWHSAVVHSVNTAPVERRSVTLLCVDDVNLLPHVQWIAPHSAESFFSSRQVVRQGIAGADLVGEVIDLKSPIALRTSAGRIEVVGRMARISTLSPDAAINRAVVVSDRGASARVLCAQGTQPLLGIRTPDRAGLTESISMVVDFTRSMLSLRPKDSTPLTIETDDRIGQLVERLSTSVRRVAWIAPAVIGMLCGISALAVNLVYNVERIGEFAIMRAVGCTKADLMRLLAYEALIVCTIACLPSVLLSLMSLATGGASAERWASQFFALIAGFLMASLLTAIGMMLPGVHSARATSIAALERAG